MSQRFVLFGHPVAHSMSPAIHAAAYRELGLPHRYELVDAPDEAAFSRAVDALRRGEYAGANVTVPWKRQALELADHREPSAADVGAANVLCRDAQGRVTAHNTDVPALAEEIRAARSNPSVVVVLGSGGAGLAAVAAARTLGAAEVIVTARRWTLDADRRDWPRAEEFRRLGARLIAWPEGAATADSAQWFEAADVLIQATSAGMHGAESGEPLAQLIPWGRLPSHTFAYDLVYNPPETAFLRAARARGLEARHGLGMLVGQAALAIELWLDARPPRAALLAAAEAALAMRTS